MFRWEKYRPALVADVGCWRGIVQGVGVASGTSRKKWPWDGAGAAVLGSGQVRPEMEVLAVSLLVSWKLQEGFI